MSYDIHNSPLYAKRKAKFTRQMLRTSPSDSSGKRIPQSGAFSWKKWAKALLVLVFISGFGYLIYLFVTLPSLDGLGEDTLSESTKILDKNGYLLYEIHAGENRTLVDLGTLPTYLPMAFIAIEDDNFYNHYGFDLIGMIKGPLEGLLPGQRARGGSTITQQLVKNALLSSERTISRKLRELLISIQLEMKYDKDSILEMYLNHIAFGSNSYGIESAANTFFGKTSGQLTLAQSAMMAALPKAPSYYSPYGSHPDKLLARRNTVLYRMFELGYISQEDYNEALEEKLEVIPYKEEIVAPHFVMYVIEQLEEQYGRVTLEKEGFKVYTTIDLELQNIAQEAVEWGVERNVSRYDATNASLVAIDPKTGSIQAMVGSVDYFDTANDGNVNVSLAQRQPGSSFKPFAFAAAFLKGYSPATVVYDVETDFAYPGSPNSYVPQNYDETFRGPISFRSALAMSLNIPAVKALYLAGVQSTMDLVKSMGITTLTRDANHYGLSLVLGGWEVKLLEMVSAYGVFANQGQKVWYYSIEKIIDRDNKVIFEAQPAIPEIVFSPEIAYQVTNVLSDNIARSPAFGTRNYLNLGRRPVAAKTGTTNEYRDAWTVGYTPSIVVGVWWGNNDNHAMKNKGWGSAVAAPIWHRFMSSVTKDTPIEAFVKPRGIITKQVSSLSGLLPSEYTPEDKIIYEVFAPQNIPRKQDISYTVVNVDTVSQKLANDYTPVAATVQYVFEDHHSILPNMPNWEEWVQEWVTWKRENEDVSSEQQSSGNKVYVSSLDQIPTEYTDIYTEYTTGYISPVTITSPPNGGEVSRGDIEVSVSFSGDYPIRYVEYYLGDVLVDTANQTPYVGNISIPEDAAIGGEYMITAKAYNYYFNDSTASVLVTVGEDTTAPEVIVQSPEMESRYQIGDTVPIILDAFDSQSGVSQIELYLEDQYLGMIDQAPYEFDLFIGDIFLPRKYYLSISVADYNGNINKQTVPIIIEE